MATLLLRLAGPTQGWDVETVDVTPDRHHAATRPHQLHHLLPTATGVAGLMASALGRPRGSDMSDLLGLDYFVRVDQPGRPRVEFRTTRRRTARGIVSRRVICKSETQT